MGSSRVALISGAGSGIGRATAIALGSAGFSLVLTGRRPEPLEETAEMCRQAGAEAIAVPTDVTDAGSVAGLFEAAREHFGRLDLLFNNAGTERAADPARRPAARAVAGGRRRQPDRSVPAAPRRRSG